MKVSRRMLRSMGVVWATSICFGLIILLEHTNKPGAVAFPPEEFPAALASFAPAGDRFRLLLFAHPDCPCTQATLSELAKLLTRLHGKLEADIYVGKPNAAAAAIEQSAVWKTAAAIPGVSLIADPEGKQAAAMGARVSGQVYLYSPMGQLTFSGGITISRGHQGDNPGTDRIIRIVTGATGDTARTPVFGCALGDPEPNPQSGDAK